jgi:hypothetical protein
MDDRRRNEESTVTTAFGRSAKAGSRRARLLAAVCAAALAGVAGVFLAAPGVSSAETGITQWSASVSTAQAGGHPDLDFQVEWKTHIMGESNPCHCDDARVVIQHFPTGFIGNTHAIATCTAAQLSTNHCPVEAQLGASDVGLGYTPLYNMETAPDQAGLIAFVVPLVASPALIDLSSRTESDYGLDATSAPIFHVLAIPGIKLHLWGVPALTSHDSARFFWKASAPASATIRNRAPTSPGRSRACPRFRTWRTRPSAASRSRPRWTSSTTAARASRR